MTKCDVLAVLLVGGLGLSVMVAGCSRPVGAANETNATVAPTMGSTVRVRRFDTNGVLGQAEEIARVVKTDAEWRKQLTSEQYEITREKGTERAFSGALDEEKKPGVYYCVCCGLPLFTSETKFDSGTGWPSFFQPIAPENVVEIPDRSDGMDRMEVECALCGGHLGHVFDDGPRPTGLRFCMDSASLTFKQDDHYTYGAAKK